MAESRAAEEREQSILNAEGDETATRGRRKRWVMHDGERHC